ncbi:GIY-YIG nuclease family protein [Idiomarina loihiensis]|uniref:GIY-YIG nuclease family protein n=1 Tax=Idiomarina loihiensis TaxID=135577 RepID=UPI0039BE3CAC
MTPSEPKSLSPLADQIIDKAIDNVNRKLVAGYRNKNNSRPNAKTADYKSTAKDTLKSASAKDTIEVSNRGAEWREMIEKTVTHGISSLKSIQFDGTFTVENGKPEGLDKVPNKPGIYVVYDKQGNSVYVGDSVKLRSRWYAGHLNENAQKTKAGEPYKLNKEFEEGCTVGYVEMKSEEAAAAAEAHLIAKERPRLNKREELKTEQGKRANIEGKKMKESSGGTASLARGAAKEAAKNSGWIVFEQLSTAIVKALKDELVDIFKGGETRLSDRIERFFKKVWSVLEGIIKAPFQLLKGIFEFIVNALSKTIRQIHLLARNLFDLAQSTWKLFKGAKTMSTEELVQKISETIITSSTLILWNALDAIIEAQLTPLVGPFAPFLAAAISAIGFGLSAHYLQKFVPQIVDFIVNFKLHYTGALEAKKEACEELIVVSERNFELVELLGEYHESSRLMVVEAAEHTKKLNEHTPIEKFDINKLLNS